MKKILDRGEREISRIEPFGKHISEVLRKAKRNTKGWVILEEMRFCNPPLKEELFCFRENF
ncbi:MAG: hypothetical protein QXX95_01245 [Nitrososphaerales archaeon]